jgi:Rrf2 family iron-sulfur cluster assembly transcriptional regulator
MKLSKTSEYALRILTFMAKDAKQIYTAKYLIESLKISDKYLRRLMTNLTKSGFVYSIQGRDGGYSFAKAPEEIYLSDIIDAVEGMNKYTGCVLGFDKCSDENPCVMHTSWLKVRLEFISAFSNKSLSQLDFDEVNKF